MNASELFKAGRLQEAVQAQTQEVKADPADPNKRLFLFELLAFAGDLDRAARQIDAISYGDPQRDNAVETYRLLVKAERARGRLFREGVPPTFLLPPPDHVRLRLDYLNELRAGRPEEAVRLLARARDATPPCAGDLNGKPFSSLRDTDDLFGTVLEVLADDKYAWVPLEQVSVVLLQGPQYPRDLLWLPARLVTTDGHSGQVFLSALYPGSAQHPDERVRLGLVTDWSNDGGPSRAVGRRVFQAGEDDVSLLDWRQLRMTPPPPGPPPAGAG
jgi:type VI secretion system protein ImpE